VRGFRFRQNKGDSILRNSLHESTEAKVILQYRHSSLRQFHEDLQLLRIALRRQNQHRTNISATAFGSPNGVRLHQVPVTREIPLGIRPEISLVFREHHHGVSRVAVLRQ
jgi:hypothetical protein